MSTLPEVELANVGAGPDPCSLAALGETAGVLVVLLQRDYRCASCRRQVERVADRHGEFEARDATVVSVLPAERELAAEWDDRFDLPYPLLADPRAEVADEFDQPARLEPLGRLSGFLGRMPVTAVFDCRDDPEPVWIYRGTSTFDRPVVDELLSAADDVLAGRDPEPAARGGGTSRPDGTDGTESPDPHNAEDG